ncbi:phage tail assembly protein [Celeribacter sp.]|uniref:phage tail assembly protein n=1 Tax=Celeribacter sp. TaxID=1890673 RepID=UPI003A9201FA
MTAKPLLTPISRGDEKITSVSLRKPKTGDLRGLKMINLMQMDVATMATLLPRITDPSLLPNEVDDLDPADFFALTTEVLGFFMTPDQVKQAQEQVTLQ